ncbi:YndJ family transporter [Natrinema longum]|uniref:YndJ family protein n=1 Tax=Natrinema longum TaxID=370324 RepID=A0A8A2UDW8_9EURY|nr:YndJ family transporter [Natrinema longum]MBZ6495130.1 YndJ family protein [Natrinema longum]QSW86886.1 YndJ family protein [Natrinema longum]
MTDLEPATPRAGGPPGSHLPGVAGRRVTDLSAAAGGVVWLGVVAGTAGGVLSLSPPALYVGLAALVLVPLGLGVLESPRDATPPSAPYRGAAVGQFPAALALVVALTAPQGSLAAVALTVPWLGVTGTIALCGLGRLVDRGGGPLPDLAIDAGLLYVPVAAAFLCLHAAGVSLRFAPIIVLLTGVHFHYAGFALPLVVGLTGRHLAGADGRFPATVAGRATAGTTVVVVAGILLIAIGITFSPLIEVVAVVAFTAGVVGFALRTLRDVVPTVARLPGLLLAVAALSLCWTMALALAFAYASLPGTAVLVTIPEMIRWHGSVNAFGFALPALLAFRLLEA